MNYRKLLIGAILVGVTMFVTLTFSKPIHTFSNSDWVNETLTKSSQLLSEAGYTKKQELKAKPIDSTIEKNLDPFIQEQVEELEKAMENYYNLKLDGFSEDSQEVEKVKQQVVQLRTMILERYQEEIDLMFAE